MTLRPCIDIHKGKVKQIIGSTLGSEVSVNFESQESGTTFAEIFHKYRLKGGHICVLDKSEASFNLAKSILLQYKHWQIGGGINAETARQYLDAGAEKVIISSALFKNKNPSKSPFLKGNFKEDLIFEQAKALSKTIGRKNLVFDLSCKSFSKKYYIMIHGWKTKTDLEVSVKTLKKLSAFCSEFLIHGVSVEGKKSGFDTDLVAILTKFKQNNPKNIAITYAGGLHSLDDIRQFQQQSQGLLDFTVGSSLDIYGGELSLSDILNLKN